MEKKKSSKSTTVKSKAKSVSKTKAFIWVVKHRGKTSMVSANTAIGAKKEAKRMWGIKGELKEIEAYIKR